MYLAKEFSNTTEFIDTINKLAKEYKSFRVVTVYERCNSCDTMTHVVLMWFDQKDYEAYTLAKS